MLIACWDCQPEKTSTPCRFCLWHSSNTLICDRRRRRGSHAEKVRGRGGLLRGREQTRRTRELGWGLPRQSEASV